ncbi:MAG: hypothetical protein PHF70_03945 [Opitutales bacterium]|nr:hypothetical protein [Opitutales bacterium]
METEGPALGDGEFGEQPDQLPSEYRIGQRADMKRTKNVGMRGLTPFAACSMFLAVSIAGTVGYGSAARVGSCLLSAIVGIGTSMAEMIAFGATAHIQLAISMYLSAANQKAYSDERKAYSKRCKEQPPPGLSFCEIILWELNRNRDCSDMRQSFHDRWHKDSDPSHMEEIARMNRAIDKGFRLYNMICI